MFSINQLLASPLVQILAVLVLIISIGCVGYCLISKEQMEDVMASVTPQVASTSISGQEYAPSPPDTGRTEVRPEDLLPKPSDVKGFENSFPIGQGPMASNNFLKAGFNIGINTVSSTHKNPNLQLRSDPYIPREKVSPWGESTILPSDLTNRKTFEIGQSA